MYLIYGCRFFFFSFNTVTVLTRTTAKCTSWILNNGHKPPQLDHLWMNVTLQLCLYQPLTRLHCVLLKLVGINPLIPRGPGLKFRNICTKLQCRERQQCFWHLTHLRHLRCRAHHALHSGGDAATVCGALRLSIAALSLPQEGCNGFKQQTAMLTTA